MSQRALELARLQREAARLTAEAQLRDATHAWERARARTATAVQQLSDAVGALEGGQTARGAADARRLLLDVHGLQAMLDDARLCLQRAQQEENALALALQQARQAFEASRRAERVTERALERRPLAPTRAFDEPD